MKYFDLNKAYQYLLICLAFFLPLTVAGGNLIIAIIVLIWLFSGDYKAKFNHILNNNLLIFSIAFFGIHVIGLLWTEDLNWGLNIVKKMWYFLLLLPILHSIVDKKFVKYYISSFLLAISFTEIISYLIWFELIDPIKNATVGNPTPFMSHISYNPILAFAIYLVNHKVLFDKDLTKLQLSLYSFFSLSMSINMFITGGRAGQVMFFVMLTILIFQYFRSNVIKALIVISILIPAIFFLAYETSNLFQSRVNTAIDNVANYSKNQNTSVGMRITFAKNSWEIFKKNPIFGVGTGDFPSEYNKISSEYLSINTSNVDAPSDLRITNPHNMYALVMVQTGIFGLISMLSIFFIQIKLSFQANIKYYRDVGLVMPILFLVIMWSDSYLLGHYTTLLYIFFSSFLYNNFEEN